MPILEIARKEVATQPILFVRRYVTRDEIAQAIGEGLGAAFALAQRKGCAIAGPPFARYPSMGADALTIEIGCPVAAATDGEGQVEAGTLQGGPAAVALHAGPYTELPEAFAAIGQWMTDNGHAPGGPPWESYLTDPEKTPNPADWRTAVYWPLAR